MSSVATPSAVAITNLLFRYAELMDLGDFEGAAALFDGAVVGFHQVGAECNALIEDNVVFHVEGAAFVTEVGDEVGAFVHNIAIRSLGSGDGMQSREDVKKRGLVVQRLYRTAELALVLPVQH